MIAATTSPRSTPALPDTPRPSEDPAPTIINLGQPKELWFVCKKHGTFKHATKHRPPRLACRLCTKADGKRHYKKHRERIRKTQNEWRERNPGRIDELVRQWNRRHPEKRREINRRWYKQNPEKVRETARNTKHRRRTREQDRQWLDLRSTTDPCPLCLEAIDHSLVHPDPLSPSLGHEPPVSREDIEGPGVLRWEHWRCNNSKNGSTDPEYFKRKEETDER